MLKSRMSKIQERKTKLVEMTFEVEAELYEQAKAIIEGLGMTMDEAITLFFKAVIAYGKIPFDNDNK